MADGDGQDMRDAISIYDQWKRGVKYIGKSETKIRALMTQAISNPEYKQSSKRQLVDRIINVYATNIIIPTNDEGTLIYLGIRKQCLEWAMTISLNAGGVAKNYQNAGSVSRKDVRPGMGYYNLEHHAMIIIDVYYDQTGTATKLKVAESNYASKWSNPPGDIPWERTIGTRDNVKFGLTIVNYDKE